MSFKIVSVLVVLALLSVVGCSFFKEVKPSTDYEVELPPDFSNWEVRKEFTPDVDKDGQPDIKILSCYDTDLLQSSHWIVYYTLLKEVKEKSPDLLIWTNFTRDENRPQKDGACLVIKSVTRFYVKEGNEFRFIQEKVLSRPEEVTEITRADYVESGSAFEKLLVKMFVQAGLSEEVAVKRMPYCTWRPEEPAE